MWKRLCNWWRRIRDRDRIEFVVLDGEDLIRNNRCTCRAKHDD